MKQLLTNIKDILVVSFVLGGWVIIPSIIIQKITTNQWLGTILYR
jgi:hypothetical protein